LKQAVGATHGSVYERGMLTAGWQQQSSKQSLSNSNQREPMLRTYKGSCHCGAVRYEADIDLSAGTGKCNCSICRKSRAWGALIKPEAFRLVAGEDQLSDYQFGSKQGHRMFCKHCGLQPFSYGHVPEIGGDFVSVNVACLDDVPDQELAALSVRYSNGRDNDWMNPPVETGYL
jgi:hypothetical protein